MSNFPFSLRSAWRNFQGGWQTFFHEPIDARIPALVRIAYALVLLVNIAVWLPDLTMLFGEHGLLPREVVQKIGDPHRWSLWAWLPKDDLTLQICYGIFVAQVICLLLGLATRFNSICVFVWLVSFQVRNPLILDGEDTVFRLIAFFLVLMPAEAVWSLDARLRERFWPTTSALVSPVNSPRFVSAWGLRLLQFQIALVFFSAAICKLQGEAWLDGTALYYVTRLQDFRKFPTPGLLFETPTIVALLTWSVILVEFTVPLLIWFRETRCWMLLLALLFHAANEYSMHLFLFHWIMLVGWLSFLLPADWEWARGRARANLEK
jgi:hypothetical protein